MVRRRDFSGQHQGCLPSDGSSDFSSTERPQWGTPSRRPVPQLWQPSAGNRKFRL